MMIELPRELQKRLAFWLTYVPEKSFPIYLVGGTVRDTLLKRSVEDIDFVLLGAKELFNSIKSDNNFAGIVLGENKQKTCYRLVNRKNTNDYIDLCEIEGESIEEDLSCRDLTLNAIALELNKNAEVLQLIDPFGGAQHTREKKVVTLGYQAFREDPLRLLRAFRFSGTLGFCIEDETITAISENRGMIRNVSMERIRDEFLKILACDRAAIIFRQMDETGLLAEILPEIVPMRGCEQNKYHHLDVWEHSLLTMENGEKIINNLSDFYPDSSQKIKEILATDRKKELLKFAVLLHDVAKPASRRMKDTGQFTFYGHDEAGVAMIENIGKRLKFSNNDVAFLAIIVLEHLHVKVLQNEEVKASTRMRWFQKYRDNTAAITLMGMADILSKNARLVTDEVVQQYRKKSGEELQKYFTDYKKSFALKPLLTGKDLIDLGLSPNKVFKTILCDIREAQLNGSISTKEDAIDILVRQKYLKKV